MQKKVTRRKKHSCIDCKKDINYRATQAKRCEDCKRISDIKVRSRYNRNNPDIIKKSVVNYRKRHPDRIKKQNKERAGYKKEWKLMIRYKISLDDWNNIFKSQRNRCAICRTDNPRCNGWCTDHDHKTGVVRGILCAPCNWLLGLAKDDKKILKRAIDYLRKSNNS